MAGVEPIGHGPSRGAPIAAPGRPSWAGQAAHSGARPREQPVWRLDQFNKFLLSASPVARVTAGVGREVCRALGFSRLAFLRADLDARWARGAAGYGLDTGALGRIKEPFEASPWIENCFTAGRPGFTHNAARGAVPLRYVRLFSLGPLLCVPVTCSRGSIGVMLLDRRGDPFGVTDELLQAAAAVGGSLGLALEAAATYERPAVPPAPSVALTTRQQQMLRLLSRGLSNKEIATATGLSVFTVRDYVSSLLRSLDVDSRSAAVARGWELGLLGQASN